MTPSHKKPIVALLSVVFALTYLIYLTLQGPVVVNGQPLPIPGVNRHGIEFEKQPPPSVKTKLSDTAKSYVADVKQTTIRNRRQGQIDKVKAFFDRYGSPLVDYAHIFVDKSHECGGDYRVLVGIAGSESGLGRKNVLSYNPFGYLDGVQYPDQKTALEILSCRVSEQHISKCGTDLYCLVDRYAGPQDDREHFVSKVRWFYNQVD